MTSGLEVVKFPRQLQFQRVIQLRFAEHWYCTRGERDKYTGLYMKDEIYRLGPSNAQSSRIVTERQSVSVGVCFLTSFASPWAQSEPFGLMYCTGKVNSKITTLQTQSLRPSEAIL